MSSTHVVQYLTPEDRSAAGGGRPLYAYGPYHVARLAKRARRTVARALIGGVPLHEPAEAVAWALASRGRRDLADAVLVALDYAPRHARSGGPTWKLAGGGVRLEAGRLTVRGAAQDLDADGLRELARAALAAAEAVAGSVDE